MAYYESSHHLTQLFFNSDAIQIPYFWHYLIYQNGSISHWYFPNFPFLFPDVFLAGLISIFTTSIPVVALYYAFIQSALFVLSLACIFQAVFSGKFAWRMGIFTGLCALALLAQGKLSNSLLVSVLQSNYHFGSTLMVFFCFSLFLVAFKKQNKVIYSALFFLGVISTISDSLFIFYFTLGVASTLFISWCTGYINFNRLFKLAIYFISLGLVSTFVFNHLPLNIPKLELHLHFGLIYFYAEYVLVKFLFKANPIIMSFWVAYLFIAPVIFFYRFLTVPKTETKEFYITFTILFAWMLVIVSGIGLAIVDTILPVVLSKGYYGMRHMQPFILAPLFIGWPMIIYQYLPFAKGIIKNSIAFSVIILALLIPSALHFKTFNMSTVFNYYPAPLACVDAHAKKLDLHAGIAGYWLAKPMTTFSKTHQVIAAFAGSYLPFLWITTDSYFLTEHFDYVIVKSPSYTIPKDETYKAFGKPTSTFSCGKNYEVYVYKNGAINHFYKKLLKGLK